METWLGVSELLGASVLILASGNVLSGCVLWCDAWAVSA